MDAESDELALFVGVPACVLKVLKALGLHLLRDFAEHRESGGAGGRLGAKRPFRGHLHVSNAGDDIDPWKQQPAGGTERSNGFVACEAPADEEGGGDHTQVSDSEPERATCSAQGDADDSATENKKQVSKHGRRRREGAKSKSFRIRLQSVFFEKGE